MSLEASLPADGEISTAPGQGRQTGPASGAARVSRDHAFIPS